MKKFSHLSLCPSRYVKSFKVMTLVKQH